MTARIIDGKAVARKLRAEYAERIATLKSRYGVLPGIAVILVGDNAASEVYVRNKITACKDTGIHSELYRLPADTPEAVLMARIDALNADPAVHGILVQLPLPAHISVPNVLERADEARVTAARADIGNLVQALKLYKLDNLRYPSGAQGLDALVARPTTDPVPANWKPYLDKLPKDPWGNPYRYLNPGIKAEVDVMSFGPTGQPGGEGKNAEIGSWQ